MRARRRFGFLAVILALSLMLPLAVIPVSAAGSNSFSSYTYSRQYVVEQGIMKGDGNGNYMFEDYVKRGDCILLIVRTFEFPTYSGFQAFADVPDSSYYRDAIATMRAIGVAKGDGTNFFPERNITLEEGILLVSRSLLLADAKYKNPTASEEGMRALFGTRSFNDKATRDDIAAMLYYARTGNAPDKPYKSESTGGIQYSTQSGKAVTFSAADFVAAAPASASPAYVKFTLPAAAVGRLYYRYGSTASQQVTAATAYYISGTPAVSQVSFVPASSYLGTATIVYTAYNTAGQALYTGEIKITVTKGQNASEDEVIRYSSSTGAPVTFRTADFEAVCALLSADTISFLRFTPPSTLEGALTYYDGTTTRTLTYSTFVYTSKYPLLSSVIFTPASDFSGTVEIPYTAYNKYSEVIYTSKVLIEVGTSVTSSGVIHYRGTKNTDLSFNVTNFVDAAAVLSGGGLSYVQFVPPSNIFGRLYYRYGSTAQKTVAPSDAYYVSQSPRISDVSFVPAEDFTGTLTIAYRAFNTAGTQLFAGTIKIEISNESTTSKDSITYSVQREGVVTFNASDFASVCAYLTGQQLGYVRFTLPDTASGRLYYRYGLSGEALVKETDTYYTTGTPGISSVSFVTYWSAPDVITIPYRAYSVSGGLLYTGTVTIQVGTGAQANPIKISVTSDKYVTFFAFNFTSVAVSEYEGKKLDDPYYIQFQQPSSSAGQLYQGYGISGGQTLVNPATKYALSGSPNVSQVSFVPNRNFNGTAEITYNAYSQRNELLYTGKIYITVTRPGGSTVTSDTIVYTVDAGGFVNLSAYDFAAVGIYLVGQEPAYVRFILPSTTEGKLYYRYGKSGQAAVSPTTNYYLNDSLYLSEVSFVAANTASGTVTVTYRAYNDYNQILYTGYIVFEVQPAQTYAPDLGTLYYTVKNTDYIYIPPADIILAVADVTSASLSYVTFTPPSSSYGRLTFSASSSSTQTAVTPVTKLFVNGAPALSSLRFTPSNTFSGAVLIPYTAYSAAGVVLGTGTIQIYVTY